MWGLRSESGSIDHIASGGGSPSIYNLQRRTVSTLPSFNTPYTINNVQTYFPDIIIDRIKVGTNMRAKLNKIRKKALWPGIERGGPRPPGQARRSLCIPFISYGLLWTPKSKNHQNFLGVLEYLLLLHESVRVTSVAGSSDAGGGAR